MFPCKNPSVVQWSNYDFEANRYLWLNRGFDKAEPVRQRNLTDLANILDDAGVFFWLQGKTLLGLHSHGVLLDDHDDDVGAFEKDRSIIETIAFPKLRDIGFAMIRNNADIMSFIRDDRYIDVCLFKTKGNKIGYGQKWFPKKYYASFDSVEYEGKEFAIPSNAERLLREMYAPNLVFRGLTSLKTLFRPSRYVTLYNKILRRATCSLPHVVRKHMNLVFMTAGMKYVRVSEEEFLSTLIEPSDSFNWRWRRPHLDIITKNGKFRRVDEIIQYLKSEKGVDRLIPEIRDTDTSRPFLDPANYDKRFWQSGNNFFAYCIIYQFRHGVVPYADANEYIKQGHRPCLYTSDYYETRRSMSDEEIERLLKEDAIEITDGAITSGKHRACAMIGRLVSGRPYIPFWAIEK